MSKHTPGPWRVTTKEDNQYVNDEYNGVIALDGPRTNAPGFSIVGCISIHDARLISCAPEMLQALKDAKELLETVGPRNAISTEAEALCAKLQSLIQKAESNE